MLEIKKDRITVTVEVECQCISEADLYIVDECIEPLTGKTDKLLWDVEKDVMAIGFGFRGLSKPNNYGWAQYGFDRIVEMPSKLVAFDRWVALRRG